MSRNWVQPLVALAGRVFICAAVGLYVLAFARIIDFRAHAQSISFTVASAEPERDYFVTPTLPPTADVELDRLDSALVDAQRKKARDQEDYTVDSFVIKADDDMVKSFQKAIAEYRAGRMILPSPPLSQDGLESLKSIRNKLQELREKALRDWSSDSPEVRAIDEELNQVQGEIDTNSDPRAIHL